MSEEQPDQTLQLEPYCLTLTSSHQRRTLTLEVYFRCLGRMRISSTGSIFRIRFEGNAEFIKLALRKEVPIVPLISTGAHDTLIVLTDFYDQVRQLHEAGLLWPFGIDPEVFPMYLGLPWAWGLVPCRIFRCQHLCRSVWVSRSGLTITAKRPARMKTMFSFATTRA